MNKRVTAGTMSSIFSFVSRLGESLAHRAFDISFETLALAHLKILNK